MTPPPGLPAGLVARAPLFSEAAEVTAVVAACEAVDVGLAEIDVEDVRSDWRRASFDLEADAVVVLSGDRVVAQAEVFRGWRAEANVHPDLWGRGVGSWLLGWTEERATAAGSARVGQTLSDTDLRAVGLVRAAGYEPRHTAWVLRIENTSPPARPRLPRGTRIRDFASGQDDQVVFRLIDEAFNEWPDREPSTFGDWAAKTICLPGFEPWHLPVAVLDGEIVGAAHLITYDDEGWIGQLAVQRQARGRGIARALLQHSFGAFFARGKHTCGLSTDSRTGALGLYERAGMRVTRSYTHYAKAL